MKFVLGLTALLAGCAEPEPTRVIAWPGMAPAEYNRLNAAIGSRVSPTELDWIAVSSPMVLELRYRGETIEFPTTAGAGGLQILSGKGLDQDSLPLLRELSFDIGPSYTPVEEAIRLVAAYCLKLHRLAGTGARPGSKVPPDAQTLVRRLRASNLQSEVLCFGKRDDFAFEISAGHYAGGFFAAEDFSLISLDGYLGLPVKTD